MKFKIYTIISQPKSNTLEVNPDYQELLSLEAAIKVRNELAMVGVESLIVYWGN